VGEGGGNAGAYVLIRTGGWSLLEMENISAEIM
jgi:hypothetical protein